MNKNDLHKKEDEAIGCSIGAIILLGLAMLFLVSLFSFTELLSNTSAIYAILFLALVFLLILYIQHQYSKDKVGNLEFKFKVKTKEYNQNIEQNNREYNQLKRSLQNDYAQKEERLHKLIEAKSPLKYLASAYADAVALIFTNSANYLTRKSHPARSAAEEVRNMRNEAKRHAADAKLYQYQYELLLHSMPSVEDDIKDDDSMEIVEDYYKHKLEETEDYDKVQDYVSKEEYAKLSVDERNQLAFERYLKSRKSKWQIGRDYEVYVCHFLQHSGYIVEHTGANGLEDLGRDIIAHKDGYDFVIQCKYWSHKKVIREKYIMQLYGTTIAYQIQNSLLQKPRAVFIANIELSDMAQKFAKALDVDFVKMDILEYPLIKCNINQGNKIYHLPFDQQYDRTQICKPGEFYACSVKEAVDAGFRRAYRHNF